MDGMRTRVWCVGVIFGGRLAMCYALGILVGGMFDCKLEADG